MPRRGTVSVKTQSLQDIIAAIGGNPWGGVGPDSDVGSYIGRLILPHILPALRPIIGQIVSDAVRRQSGKGGPNGGVQGLGRPKNRR